MEGVGSRLQEIMHIGKVNDLYKWKRKADGDNVV